MTPAVATAAIEDFQQTFAAVRAEMARVVIGLLIFQSRHSPAREQADA